MSFRSPLGQARGLGSAKSGTEHWMAQRLSAVAMLPLTAWFVWSVLCVASASHAEFVAWVAQPVVAILLCAYALVLFFHAQLGLQIVIEDYVHHEGLKVLSIVFVKLGAVFAALSCVVSVILLAVGAQ